MTTNTMMLGCLVAMVTVQAWVWCLRVCFSRNGNWEKTLSHSARNDFLQMNFTVVYAMNQNGWLAFNASREKNLGSYNLQKQASLANTRHQCFACCSKRIRQISIILVTCIECSSTFGLRPRKLEMLKAWHGTIRMSPFTFSTHVWTFEIA